jgi:hypothetical protein
LHHYHYYCQVTADEINLRHVTYFINVAISLSGRFFPIFLIMPMFACMVGENIILSDQQQQNIWAFKRKWNGFCISFQFWLTEIHVSRKPYEKSISPRRTKNLSQKGRSVTKKQFANPSK